MKLPPIIKDKAREARPIRSGTDVFKGSKFLRTRKTTLNPIESMVRASQRVGELTTTKTSAKKTHVRGYLREQDGEMVFVEPHTREAGQKKKTKKRLAKEEKAKRSQEDIEAWKKWKKGGKKPEDLKPLLDRFSGMINAQASVYKGKGRTPIPPEAIDAEFKKQFVRALNTYDPSKGKLGSWVYSSLRAAKRFISTNQNVARIPETLIRHIGEFKTAREHLEQEVLGRPPTDKEISDYLKLPMKTVQRLSTELRSGLVRSQFEKDPESHAKSWEAQVLEDIKYELTPQEVSVYEHLTGTGGKKETQSTGEIAKSLGLTEYKVSRIRKSIAKKIEPYVRGSYG